MVLQTFSHSAFSCIFPGSVGGGAIDTVDFRDYIKTLRLPPPSLRNEMIDISIK